MKELNDFRKFLQENELHEGTWSLGTVDAMKDVLTGLANIRDKADLAMDPNNKGKGFVDGFKMALGNEAFDARMYRVFGDDSFHDYIAAARREAEVGNFDGAKNALGDALARGEELLKYQESDDLFEEGEELEENDAVLDEVSESMGIFKEIDAMVGSIKDQMDPDDAFDSLVSEFEAISGGTKLLHRALKNISLDNNLMEKKDEE